MAMRVCCSCLHPALLPLHCPLQVGGRGCADLRVCGAAAGRQGDGGAGAHALAWEEAVGVPAVLRCAQRCADRRKKKSPLPPQLWRLYKMNGERYGQLVVNKRDFKRIHLAAEGLSVMLVRDTSCGGELSCSGQRVGVPVGLHLWRSHRSAGATCWADATAHVCSCRRHRHVCHGHESGRHTCVNLVWNR